MKKIFILISALGMSCICHAAPPLNNETNSNNFVFIPIDSQRQGTFLYTEFERELLGPENIGFGWKSVILNPKPKAINSHQFENFIEENEIIDKRINLISKDKISCDLTHAAKAKLSLIEALFTFSVLPASYPFPCRLELKYYPQGDASAIDIEIIDAIAGDENSFEIAYNYSVNAVPQLSIDSTLIINELLKIKAISKDDQDNYYANIETLTYYSRNLSPELFGDNTGNDISEEAWKLFIDIFTIKDRVMFVNENNLGILSITPQTDIAVDVDF